MKKIVSVCLAVLFLLVSTGVFAESSAGELDYAAIMQKATEYMNEEFTAGTCTAEEEPTIPGYYKLLYAGTYFGCAINFNHYENGEATSEGTINHFSLLTMVSTEDRDAFEATLKFWMYWGACVMRAMVPEKSLDDCFDFVYDGLMASTEEKYEAFDGKYSYEIQSVLVSSGTAAVMFGMKLEG